MTAEEVIKRKIKVVKGAKVYMRVFPDIPVCIKVCRWLAFFDVEDVERETVKLRYEF